MSDHICDTPDSSNDPRLRSDVTPQAVEALRLAADNMPISRPGQQWAGAADWLRSRAREFEIALRDVERPSARGEVETGAGEGATGQDTGTAWVTRSEDCPEAPAQAHLPALAEHRALMDKDPKVQAAVAKMTNFAQPQWAIRWGVTGWTCPHCGCLVATDRESIPDRCPRGCRGEGVS